MESVMRWGFGRFSFRALAAGAVLLLVPPPCLGARVYILRGGDQVADTGVSQALQERGHNANLGVETPDFDGTQVKLADFDAVFILYNANYGRRMSNAGKIALRDYLTSGGRVVTGEWFIYSSWADSTLGPVLPGRACGYQTGSASTTYTRVDPPDPIVHNGLPASFTFQLSNYGGRETCFTAAAGAKVFYYSKDTDDTSQRQGVIGRELPGGGRIISLSSLIGSFELQSADFKRLLANAVEWAAAAPATGPANLSARPATLAFNYRLGGPPPGPQQLSISGTAALNVSAAVATTSGGQWLSATPATATTPASLNVSVNAAGLAPGTYSGTVTITATTGGVSPQTVPVTLNVTSGAKVYILRGGDQVADSGVSQALQERGHNANLGVETPDFDGTQVKLADFDAVFILYNANYGRRMSNAGKIALRDYLTSGGRVVTGEWFIYSSWADSTLGPVLPGRACGYQTGSASTTYTRVDPPDPIVHNGLPASFTFQLSNYGGRETCFTAAAGAKVFYYSKDTDDTSQRQGVIGLELPGGGRIISLSSLIGPFDLQSADFKRLLANAVEWAAAGSSRPSGGTITPSPNALSFSPNTLSFTSPPGASAPPAQAINVSSPGGSVSFTAAASTASGGPWLSVNSSAGTTPATLSVAVNPAGLAAGVYNGAITITPAGGSPQPVAVTLTVASQCNYSISPLSQVFASAGGIGAIGIAADAACAWTAASNAAWLTIAAGASGSGVGTVRYSVAANTAAGSRQGTITIQGQTFTVTQSGTAVTFLLGPSPLVFSFRAGETEPQEQLLYVFSSSPGLKFSVSSVTGGNWLSAISGSASIAVHVDPGALAPGNYQGTITVRAEGAEPPARTAEIRVSVEGGGAPRLTIEPSRQLIFNLSQGSATTTGRIAVSNLGGGSVTFRATTSTDAGGTWLTVRPDSGTVTSALPASLEVGIDPAGLSPGTYAGRVKITGSDNDLTVAVVLSVSAVQGRILLSQTGLTFTAVAQAGADPPQSVGVVNSGRGVINWTAAASVLAPNGGNWLSVTPAGGTTDARSLAVPLVQVAVNPSGLAPGEYYGLIRVSSADADNSPQSISVVLNVLPPGSDPGPVLRPTGMIFTGISGGQPPGSQLTAIANVSAAPKSFSSGRLTIDGSSWFSHVPEQGTIAPAEVSQIAVQPDTRGLAPGARRGALTLLFTDGTVRNLNILLLLLPGGSAPAAVRAAAGCTPKKLFPVLTVLGDQFNVPAGWPTVIAARVVDDCGEPLRDGSVQARFSNNDGPVTLVSLKDGSWTGTWLPLRASSERVSITLTAEIPGTDVRGSTQAGGAVRAGSGGPVITPGGVPPVLAPGGIVTIYGSGLADTGPSSPLFPLPTRLGGASVVLAGRVLPLFFASEKQINAQVPYDVPVNTRHQLTVTHGSGAAVPEAVTVASAVPEILTANGSPGGPGLVFLNSKLVDAQNPATQGDVVVVYCFGLGGVDPVVPAGEAAPATSISKTVNPVTATIGGVPANVLFSGLTPNFSGLYQVNIAVPGGVAAGSDVPLVISVAGQSSPAVTTSIR